MLKQLWLIRHNHPIRLRWDILIIIMSVFISYTTPFDVAFKPAAFDDAPMRIINHTIDFAFLLDVLLSFRTTYQNKRTGDEVISSKKIA